MACAKAIGIIQVHWEQFTMRLIGSCKIHHLLLLKVFTSSADGNACYRLRLVLVLKGGTDLQALILNDRPPGNSHL